MREATIAYGGFFYLVRSLLKEWEATFAYGGFFYLARSLLKEWEATIAYGGSFYLVRSLLKECVAYFVLSNFIQGGGVSTSKEIFQNKLISVLSKSHIKAPTCKKSLSHPQNFLKVKPKLRFFDLLRTA